MEIDKIVKIGTVEPNWGFANSLEDEQKEEILAFIKGAFDKYTEEKKHEYTDMNQDLCDYTRGMLNYKKNNDKKESVSYPVVHESAHAVDTKNNYQKMSYDDFWKLVAEMDWKHKDLKEIHLTENQKIYGGIYARRFRQILQGVLEARSILKDDTLAVNDLHVSDDSFWDLTAHIVGLGKETYYKVLENPDLIKNYLGSYRENFEYCFNAKN